MLLLPAAYRYTYPDLSAPVLFVSTVSSMLAAPVPEVVPFSKEHHDGHSTLHPTFSSSVILNGMSSPVSTTVSEVSVHDGATCSVQSIVLSESIVTVFAMLTYPDFMATTKTLTPAATLTGSVYFVRLPDPIYTDTDASEGDTLTVRRYVPAVLADCVTVNDFE